MRTAAVTPVSSGRPRLALLAHSPTRGRREGEGLGVLAYADEATAEVHPVLAREVLPEEGYLRDAAGVGVGDRAPSVLYIRPILHDLIDLGRQLGVVVREVGASIEARSCGRSRIYELLRSLMLLSALFSLQRKNPHDREDRFGPFLLDLPTYRQ